MTTPTIQFLTIDDVLRLHVVAMQDQGGDPSVRDRGLLESALATPAQQFGGAYLHPDIPSMAAAYAFHICKNHPFVDGNKRAGTAAMIAFLSDNGWRFHAGVDDAERAILALAAGQTNKDAWTAWVRAACHELPRMELREFMASIDIKVLGERAIAMAADSSGSLACTVSEEMLAIPAIGPLYQLFWLCHQQGDTQSASIFANQLHTLIALARIAEDMGYEW